MVKKTSLPFASYAGQIDAAESEIVLTGAGPHPFKGLSVEDVANILQKPTQAPAIFAHATPTIVDSHRALNSMLDIPSQSLLG